MVVMNVAGCFVVVEEGDASAIRMATAVLAQGRGLLCAKSSATYGSGTYRGVVAVTLRYCSTPAEGRDYVMVRAVGTGLCRMGEIECAADCTR